MIKSLIPKSLKLSVRLGKNLFCDFKQGYTFKFAQKSTSTHDYTHQIQITQNLRPNPAKKHNLSLAKNAIESVQIMPQEIFSFWKAVGAPNKTNGFRASRSIVGNQVENSVGGGLCQLSGLMYYVSLRLGLEILERHNHSMDIYNEQTRFTPLGSDATVVYGYKDLKIRNNLTAPIRFMFVMKDEQLTVTLHFSGEHKTKEIRFEPTSMPTDKIKVQTFQDDELIDESIYKKVYLSSN